MTGKNNARQPGFAGRYLAAVAVVIVAILARQWLVISFGPMPLFITFYPAILLVAAVAGGGPGIAATLLSSFAITYWFVEPYNSFRIKAPNDAIALGIFFFFSLALSLLLERLRRSQWLQAVSSAQEQELALLVMENLLSLDPDRRVKHWSKGCSRLYGFDAQEAQGQLVDELLKSSFYCPLEQVQHDLMTHNYWEGELTRRRKDGSKLSLVILLALRRDGHGKPEAILEVSTDITRQKEADEIIRQSEEHHRTILQAAIDGFWLVNTDGRLLEVNDSYCRISGYSRQELLAMRITDLESSETAAETAAHLKKVITQGEDRFESQHRCKDGHNICVEISVQFRPTDGGHFVVFVRDISLRKRAEEALKESEYFFRESQRAAFIGSYKADFIAGYWESSEVLDTIFGIDTNYDRTVQGWLGIVHPEDRDSMCHYLQEDVIAKGMPFSKEYRIIRQSDNVTRWVNGSGEVKVGRDGTTTFMIGTILDITDQKLAFEQLANISCRLQLATASANLGVWDWNVRENRMDWDDRMFELYGIAPETFPNNIDAWTNGLHPDDKEAAVAACESALVGEQEFDTTFRVCHPDGSVKHIKANGLVIRGKDGIAERMIGVNVDITNTILAENNRVELEAQLYQAQKMESVGRLAGGVAHDFNNMLTVILGNAQLALLDVNPTKPLHVHLEAIRNAAERSASLTRQLLAFARKQIIAPKVLDLNGAVSGMLMMLQRLIGEDIHLVWQPATNLWPVMMDSSQLDQVLANLCVNSRDAIDGVGKISIETENRVVGEDYCGTHFGFLPGEYVRLVVSDNGQGMDKETLSHIFEPFFTTKGLGEGTGLGLATVYGIVKQNNGFVNVYSEPKRGTTFTIYLPRHVGGAVQSEKDGTTGPIPCGHETILLVEDEAAILQMTTQMLENLGYTVLAANSPSEAIRFAREFSGEVNLLMTDVIMPEMNGRDLAKNLHSVYPNLKQLFMSGYTSNVIVHHGVLEDGVYFIQKPFSMQGLAAKLRELLDPE